MESRPAFSTDNFIRNFQDGKTQLAWQWLSADMETPVSAYMKLCGDAPYSFLFESVEGGASLGRYSIIGFAPDMVWNAEGKTVDDLRKAIAACRIDIVPDGLPPMAASGLFGYFGYDMIRLAEDIPDTKPESPEIPDSLLIRPSILAIFDNVRSSICLVTPVYETKGDAQAALKSAQKRLEAAAEAMKVPALLPRVKTSLSTPLRIESSTDKEKFLSSIQKAIDYIYEGDIFQVVLSQRFSTDFDLPPFELYRSLRSLNPSPFLFYLNLKDFSLVGSSPEILVRVRGGTVTIRPIAGTRPRGATPAEDKALADSLLNDPKERAEHLMLLDLGRNDVGRIAEYGSVKVTDQFTIEHYSHVMHIVSNVEGRLRQDLDIVDALLSGFPAGTVSGAPKIRAMQIIDELETLRRGYYGGGVGYFSGNGEMDTCIALRTGLVKDGTLYVQAGAGIVADSQPESEYEETVNKAKAVFKAAELAALAART